MSDTLKPPPANADVVLSSIVRVANEIPNFEVGLTISVKGALITGIAVGWKSYFGRSIAQISDEEDPRDDAGMLVEILRIVGDWQDTDEKGNPDIKSEPQFIHLRNAKYLVGTDLVPSSGTLWRGRLSEIDGFSFGLLA